MIALSVFIFLACCFGVHFFSHVTESLQRCVLFSAAVLDKVPDRDNEYEETILTHVMIQTRETKKAETFSLLTALTMGLVIILSYLGYSFIVLHLFAAALVSWNGITAYRASIALYKGREIERSFYNFNRTLENSDEEDQASN